MHILILITTLWHLLTNLPCCFPYINLPRQKEQQGAIILNPYNADIYGALVDANVELGNYKEAVAMCDKMLSIRPDLRSSSRASYIRQIFGDNNGVRKPNENSH